MSLEFIDIRHAFGRHEVLSGVSLVAEAGEITCLLGPSGCGKTTLLRLAAGLLDVSAGRIRLDGGDLAAPGRNPPPEKRPVGLVFQEGALFPHLNVAQNVAFGLKRSAEKEDRVSDLLGKTGLSGREKAFPHALSGGQQQRVALARALAPEPQVVLLDEPFASVDVILRRQLREETRRVLKERGAVAILVTHDPDEAMEIGDRIAVMGGGQIIQWDDPGTLYNRPRSLDVAAMFGQGRILRGRRGPQGVETSFGAWPLKSFASPVPETGTLDLVVRPEAIDLGEGTGATVEDVRLQGPNQRFSLVSGSGERLSALVPASMSMSIGSNLAAVPREGSIFAFPAGDR